MAVSSLLCIPVIPNGGWRPPPSNSTIFGTIPYKSEGRWDRDFDRIGSQISVDVFQYDSDSLSTSLFSEIDEKMNKDGSVFAVAFDVLRTSLQAQRLVSHLKDTGKFVYVIGASLSPDEVGELLGINVTGRKHIPDPEDTEKWMADQKMGVVPSVVELWGGLCRLF